ncbi:hypothetical protein R6242_16255 [Iodobacter sp. CM08]|uniref:hypothetical protein n=1 Tax=Iodobacter sp. CM08 TaxID=3085902 RepID=UPI002981BD43|nr:hypothetical protein [Iodobacter sp. CM08]MDW5418120.1 hypothetical protein [Iodobacter sp. CM08]
MLGILGSTKVHGALIYPTKVRLGGVIEDWWAAQFRENIGSAGWVALICALQKKTLLNKLIKIMKRNKKRMN